MKFSKRHHILVILTFGLLLALTFINQTFKIMHEVEAGENRKLAEKPKLDINLLDYYPKKYEQYYTDNFGLRLKYIGLMNFFSKKIFKKTTVSGSFLIGEDNFVFEKRNNLPIFLGKQKFTDEQLGRLAIEYAKREEYFLQHDIKPYILICPGKLSIYTEKLPVFLRTGNYDQTDQFISCLHKHTNIKIVDGRKSLRKRKKQHSVYQKFDTHWNGLGSFFAYSDLMELVQEDFHQVPTLNLEDFKVDTFQHKGGNLRWIVKSDTSDMETDYKITHPTNSCYPISGYKHLKPENFVYSQDAYYQRYASSIDTIDLPKAIIFRDSYADFGKHIFPINFSETIYIWDNWQYKLNKEILEIEKPDIVIYMIVEGFLGRVLMEPSFVEPDKDEKGLQ